MRKLLLCCILFFAGSATLAQTWCPPGAKWHFKRGAPYSNSGVDGFVELRYTGNAILSGKLCQKLDATFTGRTSGPASPVVVQSLATYFTYENNNVVFLYNSGTSAFDTVMNFNALPGDKWLRPGPAPQPNGCNARNHMMVTDTGHVSINGFSLKTVKTTYTSTSLYAANTFTSIYTSTFIQRVFFAGFIYHNLFPTYCEQDNVVPEVPTTLFRCYEDDSFGLYKLSIEDCYAITGIETIPGTGLRLTAYPNPNSGSFTTELDHPARVEIVNLLGETVYAAVFENPGRLAIEAGYLPPGVYILKASTAEGSGQVKFIRQ
jgi:hypothetical protein